MSSAEKVVAIIQARMGSTRLPGKILLPLAGRPLLEHVVERGRAVAGVDEVIVATSGLDRDDPVRRLGAERGWRVFSGSEADVLDRFYRAAVEAGAAHVMRLTADCPLLCVTEAARLVAQHVASGADYSHNITVWGSGLPLGTGTEIFTFATLEASFRDGHEAHHREHVDEYVYEHPERFRIESLAAPEALRRPSFRLTVDTPEDMALMTAIYDRLHRGRLIALADVVALLDGEPGMLGLNEKIQQRTR
jgi:spore coat polysaccharide biosynthesis protein SpsF